jgi:dipeptidyl-peptidase 4
MASTTDSTLLTLQRIHASSDFQQEFFGPTRWMEEGEAYTTLERAAEGQGRDLVRYDTRTGTREVLIPAARFQPPGDTLPLTIENYNWSPDRGMVLIYTNSQPVWRTNTRGDYWILNRTSGELKKLGGPARPSTLMFAKFSPDGKRIGYVRENNLYVENLADGQITQLTDNGSRTIINGTFDWVYEEELGLQDGWRWSPDGQSIAYWQLNADSVRDFNLINDTDSLYSSIVPVQYPKAGESNSAARIGIVSVSGGGSRWLALPGDPRNNYPARMDWAANSKEVYVQRLNRLQNTMDLILGDAATGQVRTVLTEKNNTWVEVVDDMAWLDNGKSFTWLSERDGWNHVYVISRDGRSVRLVTPGNFDVLNVQGIDEDGGFVYYIASPQNPTQRYLYRARLDGRGRPERLTPADQSGNNGYNMAPNHRWAFHTYSRMGVPPVTALIQLPNHSVVRTVVENARLRARVAALRQGPREFFQVDVGDSVKLNGWIMKPADFDPARRYPILFFVYGGPGSQTVLDSWGGSQYLWFLLLNQQGYLVASVDNRGTGARGSDWRRIIYGQMGVVETRDQAAAARAIGRWPYVDSTRMGIWGWSYGGFMSLNALFQHGDVYRTAVAVAPVTHWKYYDNIYTERYNGLPQENQDGYDRGSPLTYVNQLRGDLLLVHGSGDDNVHFQNSQAMVNALVAANKQFSLMEYPNRNHGIFGGNTRLHLFTLITNYLNEHLMNPRTRPST